MNLQAVLARLVLFIFAAIVLWANGCQKRVGSQPERNIHVVTSDTAQLHSLIAYGSASELSDLLKTSVAVNAPGLGVSGARIRNH